MIIHTPYAFIGIDIIASRGLNYSTDTFIVTFSVINLPITIYYRNWTQSITPDELLVSL